MDDRSFDNLARSFSVPSRRRVLAVAGVAALTALLDGRVTDGALAGSTKKKKKKKKKRPTTSVIYVPVPAGDCPDGFRTCNGVCRDMLSDPNNCGRCGRSCGTHSFDGTTPRSCCQGRCLQAGECCLDSDCPPGDICATGGACVSGTRGICKGSLDSCQAAMTECQKSTDLTTCMCLISTENELRCGKPAEQLVMCNDSVDCGTTGGFCPRADCNPPNQLSICRQPCYFNTRFG
jgi:hypothetical protein